MQHIVSYLRAKGALDDAQLRAVRARWRRSGRPLVHALVELGHLTEEQVLTALVELTGLPVVDVAAEDVDVALLGRVPTPLLLRLGAVPLGLDASGRARVATCSPFEVVELEELQGYLQRPLELCLCPWSAIREALRAHRALQETIAQGVVKELIAAGLPNGTILPGEPGPAELDEQEAAAGGGAPEPRGPERDDARSEAADASPIVRLADLILADALRQGASDVHLEPLAEAVRLRFRLQGVLRTIRKLPRTIGSALVARIKVMSRLDITVRRLPQDGRLWFRSEGDGRVIDVRVSTLPTVEGEKVVLRLLDPRSVDKPLAALVAQADLPRYLAFVERTQGLVLVTGPTGSGKTTTLYATLRHALTDDQNFVTIEQPVEYHVDGIAQVNVRPEEGASFAGTLRAVLRQDPDVILVGEIRDGETATTAVQAATTGHLVLSTLHTNDAASACTRLVELGAPAFMVADALNGVLAQRLVRRLCPACRRGRPATEAEVERAGVAVRGATVFDAVGCDACAGAGYAGRRAVHEIAPATPTARRLILERRGDGQVREALRVAGVPSMFAAGLAHALCGETSLAELFRCVPQDEVEQTLSCAACGAVTPPGAKHCVACGRATASVCQGCDAALAPAWRHCAACGAARGAAKASS